MYVPSTPFSCNENSFVSITSVKIEDYDIDQSRYGQINVNISVPNGLITLPSAIGLYARNGDIVR
jgi:hypothetical protein